MKIERKIILVATIVTFFIGTYGFYLTYSSSITDCLYATISLFFMNCLANNDEINVFIEIARWAACIISANVILTILKSIFVKYNDYLLLRKKDLIVLHGDHVEILKNQLPNSHIFDHDILWKANRHVFSFKDDKSLLTYLTNHMNDINQQHQIYIVSQNIDRNDYIDQNMIVCNISETCARFYWQNYPIKEKKQEIVIIGNGNYAREIIDYAILLNVIAPDSEIHYHWFCHDDTYLLRHPEIKQCISINKIHDKMDALIIHQESFEKRRDLIEKADRIILVDDQDEENIENLNILKTYYTTSRIDMRYLHPQLIYHLWGNDLHVFGMENELYHIDYLLKDKAFETSKRIHATYLKNYVCKKECETDCVACPILLEDWNKLNPFTRYSNVTQADHITIKKYILENLKTHPNQTLREVYQSLSEEELLVLDEIEHIRWARYHYFHNWTYDKVRDKQAKKHPLLVPFKELSYEEVLKDRDTWKTTLDFIEKERKL